jgi:quercetin dioxygenase-like cupin family protein
MQAKSTVFIDNERTRVTEWRFAPGASTGWHRHEYDYVVVPLLDGKLRLSSVEHDVTNINDFEYAFIEIEFK